SSSCHCYGLCCGENRIATLPAVPGTGPKQCGLICFGNVLAHEPERRPPARHQPASSFAGSASRRPVLLSSGPGWRADAIRPGDFPVCRTALCRRPGLARTRSATAFLIRAHSYFANRRTCKKPSAICDEADEGCSRG